MNLALFIITLISLAVLLICYLLISARSFKHHSVTGLISLLPVINLLIIPSVWYHIRKPFFISTIAIVVGAASWFLGGQNYRSVISNTMNAQTEQSIGSESTDNSSGSTSTIPLPQKPLYYIQYRPMKTSQIAQTVDQYIRVKLVDSSLVEGKNKAVNKSKLQLIVGYNNTQKMVEIPLRNIKALEILNETPNP